ncbi:Cyclin, N-terminal domain containing protein [Trichomonas vaginalis G3]|uniref:Cyclin, N-terminal domain containing protein n=1 Tax=Trichomonas vaginalis (strain ATCC PRA-98 / G3) TaxID=412133 RepID=A2DZG0_TRIV3|nr:cell division [Trichomonas vaginalis G3]EAY14164.1 Cyclin, N-terminal domain containing protein [Trichomonas vaginalis G3]KAI5540705.1 cell division [Trichomonas vaginalis G3]|eukprot:XP_001326387.1 Cyclin, N-terminal domain containing protein [Trichomonas vaginalis G3]
MLPLQVVGCNNQNRHTAEVSKPSSASLATKQSEIPIASQEEYEYSDPDLEDYDEEDQFEEDSTLFIPDIDQRKIGDPKYVPMIAEKIIRNCQAIEMRMTLSTSRFSEIQTNLTAQHHELALSWIMKAFSLFKLKVDESLYKSIYYLNILLCSTPIDFSDLQLMSVVCIWIACKVEDNLHIPLSNLVMVCSKQLTEEQIKTTEPFVVNTLNCDLNPVTPLFYIHRFLDAIDADEDLSAIANLFMDLSLLSHEFLDYTPTVIAVSSVCIAKLTMNEFCPTPRLLNYSHITDVNQVRNCCSLMVEKMALARNNLKYTVWERFHGNMDIVNDLILDPEIVNQL